MQLIKDKLDQINLVLLPFFKIKENNNFYYWLINIYIFIIGLK